MAETMELLLDDIKIDGGTQSRAAVDAEVVAEYAAILEGEHDTDGTLPPGIVYYDGKNYWLADGFHRYYAHRKNNFLRMACIVRQGTRFDAMLFSAKANAAHGLRRSNADKRRSVRMILDEPHFKNPSSRWVAEKCCVSSYLVEEVRQQMIREPGASVGSDRCAFERAGKVHEMKTTNLKAKPKAEPEGSFGDEVVKGLAEFIENPPAEDPPMISTFAEAEVVADADLEPAEPFAPFLGKIRAAQSTLRAIADGLREVLEYDTTEKNLKSKWANYYSYEGTVGAINAIIRTLENGSPAELMDKSPGYLSKQLVTLRERTAVVAA